MRLTVHVLGVRCVGRTSSACDFIRLVVVVVVVAAALQYMVWGSWLQAQDSAPSRQCIIISYCKLRFEP
jgi:hypothetical protein